MYIFILHEWVVQKYIQTIVFVCNQKFIDYMFHSNGIHGKNVEDRATFYTMHMLYIIALLPQMSHVTKLELKQNFFGLSTFPSRSSV